MPNLVDFRGINQPLMFKDVIYQDISSTDVDPLATAEASRTKYQKGMIDRGFCVRGNASGAFSLYAITWNSYHQNGNALTQAAGGKADLTPVELFCTGGVWELTPLIKVYAQDDGTYPTGCGEVNIGLL